MTEMAGLLGHNKHNNNNCQSIPTKAQSIILQILLMLVPLVLQSRWSTLSTTTIWPKRSSGNSSSRLGVTAKVR